MRRYLSLFLLGAALGSPAALKADDEHHREKRYYDRDARDWHEWNEREERAYRRYWEDRHHEYREWERSRDRDRRDYWKWRHRHPDSVLFQMEIH